MTPRPSPPPTSISSQPQSSRLGRDDIAPLLGALASWVLPRYPREACGLLVSVRHRLEVWGCDNIQDTLHTLAPLAYPRSSATAWAIDPREFERVTASSGVLRGVFHSHPDRDATFSDADRRGLQADLVGVRRELAKVAFLVLSVRHGALSDWRIFGLGEYSQAVEELL